VVRGLAAVALTECRECARDALQQLIAALKDSDGDVRLKAADAIATLGKGATPAAGALTEAIAANWSDPQAERSIATALGAIGPAAAPAIPELKRLREVPRVQTQADAALQSIGAK
jgi:HEAT repeat protein